MEKKLFYTGAVYPSIVEKDVIELLSEKVECILCLDDNICMGVLNALHKNEIKIPHEVKVASCYGGRMLGGVLPSGHLSGVQCKRNGRCCIQETVGCH